MKTTMITAEHVLNIARAEEGYLEKATDKDLDSKTANAGRGNWTKYARDLDALGFYHAPKNGYAWCDIFVDWCFVEAFGLDVALALTGQPRGGYGAGCTESRNYYKTKGRYFTSDPQPGDQIFFTQDGGKTCCHTGLVERVENGTVYTIEGNTSSTPGVVDNGGCVRAKSYPMKYRNIDGYGRPMYELIEEDDDMTLDTFKKLMSEYRKELQDNDCGTWSKDARDWATSIGLIAGSGNGPDGKPNYMWSDTLTREQAAQLFYRFAQMMGKA